MTQKTVRKNKDKIYEYDYEFISVHIPRELLNKARELKTVMNTKLTEDQSRWTFARMVRYALSSFIKEHSD